MERRTKQNIEPIYPKTEIEEPKKNVGFSKNKQLCEDITRGSCLRPDIFLKNRGLKASNNWNLFFVNMLPY